MISFEPEYERSECCDIEHKYEDGYCTNCGKMQPEILEEKAKQLKLLLENAELRRQLMVNDPFK